MRADLLFSYGDVVVNNEGAKGPAPGFHSTPLFINDSLNRGEATLIIPHEMHFDASKPVAGSISYFKIKQWGDLWVPSGKFNNIRLAQIKENYIGALATTDPFNRIYIAESFRTEHTKISPTKTGKKGGLKDAKDHAKVSIESGWLTNLDLAGKRSGPELLGMGRYTHSGMVFMEDSLTVYLSNSDVPSILFKFIAFVPADYTKGQLYAYKQSSDGSSGFWLPMPMESDSLKNIRDVALQAGATFFMGLQGLTYDVENQIIYLAEHGIDDFKATTLNCHNGVIALHNNRFKKNEEIYDNPYGGILKFDIFSDRLDFYLPGGKGHGNYKVFSNPSSITTTSHSGKLFLIINEDLPNTNKGRTTTNLFQQNILINESWWLDLSIENPLIDHLNRFMIAPPGATIKGGSFSGDDGTYFFSLQNPSPHNVSPFNRSGTYGITGFRGKILKDKKQK